MSAWRARLAPFALAATPCLAVGGAFLYQATRSSSRVLAAELAMDHEKCFRLNALLGTQHSPEAVEAAMSSGFGWNMHLPDTSAHEDVASWAPAVPVRRRQGGAHHVHAQRTPGVALHAAARNRADQLVQVFGHQCRIWSEGDRHIRARRARIGARDGADGRAGADHRQVAGSKESEFHAYPLGHRRARRHRACRADHHHADAVADRSSTPRWWSSRSVQTSSNTEPTLSCPTDAKPANLDFTLKDVEGRDVVAPELQGQGRSCSTSGPRGAAPARSEIPHFIEFQQKYGPQGLQIVSASRSTTPVDKLVPYVKEMGMNYPVLQGLGHDDVQDAYRADLGIPVTCLIRATAGSARAHRPHRQGRVRARIKALL